MLFHVSPAGNHRSILLHGVCPRFAQARSRQRSWFVTHSRLRWAIRHVTARHACRRVYIYLVPTRRTFRRAARGIWTSTRPTPVYQWCISER